MVETTASLATSPESSETLFCHSPKPRGAKMGAINAPRRPNMDCAGSVTICKEGEKDWRNQTTTLMAKMMVPARTMKSLARSQRRRATFFTDGTR